MSNLSQDEWTQIAELAVQAYGLPATQIRRLSQTHNTVFQVMAEAKRYVLRLQMIAANQVEWLRSELTYLRILHDMTPLHVPYPHFTRLGEPYAQITPANHPTVYAVLFKHLDGKELSPADITPEQAHKIGDFLGKLHQFSPQFPPPAGFQRPMLDWNGLFGEESLYDPQNGHALFADEMLAVIEQVTARVRESMDVLGRDKKQFGMIHGDLLLKNILFHEAEVYALDFEYCGWGYFLYDLAPLLWQLKLELSYEGLEAALWDGYTAIQHHMASRHDLLETMVAARQVASCRWIAKNQHHPYVKGKAASILAQRVQELVNFLETGTLQRQDTQP